MKQLLNMCVFLCPVWVLAAQESEPLWVEPPPRPVVGVRTQNVDLLYDFIEQTFVMARREKKQLPGCPCPARDVNTLGEVPDSAWYTNRHWLRPMSLKDLMRGPGDQSAPDREGAWEIVSAKSDGVTPGFLIKDPQGRKYMLKFDPPEYPELSSAADVIGSKFFYALGYNVPENYIVRFHADQLRIGDAADWRDAQGRKHALTAQTLRRLLREQPRDTQGRIRAVASLLVGQRIVGPFSYSGSRSDDPNDVFDHEYRRELRGLRVFASWLNHTDVKAINTLDVIAEENGRRYLKHFLIDFGSILGSDGVAPKDARMGHEYLLQPGAAGMQVLGLGVYTPAWMRQSSPHLKGLGNFEAVSFDPAKWKTDYPNPAFVLMDRDDAFWAAKQVARFSDAEIRAIVSTGEYSDPRTADWITATLIERRNRIVRTWLSGLLAADNFRIEGGRLKFDVLPQDTSRPLRVQWETGSTEWNVPEGQKLTATVSGERPSSRVDVRVARVRGVAKVVSLNRNSRLPDMSSTDSR
jgi:hypothetical protein